MIAGSPRDRLEKECRKLSVPADLYERGKRLRLDIQELHESMTRNKTLRPGINDVSNFMRRVITEDTSFEDAEHILRCAGFDVLERPDINAPDDPHWPNRNDKYDVIATMRFSNGFLSRVELMLGLSPKFPGDYSTVKDVRAAIVVSYP